MVKLYSHPEDPGSYCFTLQGTRQARSPDPVEEAKEMMTQTFGNAWVPPGESVVRCGVRLQSCTITCVAESWDRCCCQRLGLGMPLRVSSICMILRKMCGALQYPDQEESEISLTRFLFRGSGKLFLRQRAFLPAAPTKLTEKKTESEISKSVKCLQNCSSLE